MNIQKFTPNQLRDTKRDLASIRACFGDIALSADAVSEGTHAITEIAVAARGTDAITIQFGAMQVDLLLTFSRDGHTGRLFGRVTAMLVKHPLERTPVDFGWFSFKDDEDIDGARGFADFDVPQGLSEQPRTLKAWGPWIVLTMVEKALTHLPATE